MSAFWQLSNMTHSFAVNSLLSAYASRLEKAGVDSPALCARMILGEALGMSRAGLVVHSDMAVGEAARAACEKMLARREKGEPMAYILGRKEFYGRDFAVRPGVLVPRPETELLVELALDRLPLDEKLMFADFGCGSGCILVTLLLEARNWRGVGVDISKSALEVSRENIGVHKVADRAGLLDADFTKNPFQEECLDFIVSNPPYISSEDYKALGFEVKDFEPRLALESGPEGLDHPRQVVEAAGRILKPGGWLFMEIGSEQGEAAMGLFSGKIWAGPELVADLAGLDRVAAACKR